MAELSKDIGSELMTLLCTELKRRLSGEEAQQMKSSDFEVVRKLLESNSITFASVQRGDFGTFAQGVAEETYAEFAGDETGAPRFQ